MQLRRLKSDDTDLAQIAAELNAGDNEISVKTFTEASLREFLSDANRFYLIATIDGEIAGALHGYNNVHPAGVNYLYVDEVDTIKKFRRRGVATAMMKEALMIARDYGADELWLGTEHDNEPAKALYLGLNPTEIENGPIYSYKIKTEDTHE